MDPITILILGGAAIALFTVIFWEDIIAWAHSALFPWFDKHLPTLSPHIKKAFVVLNKAVSTVRKVAVQSWKKLRPYLIGLIERFIRVGEDYKVETTVYAREDASEKNATVQTTTQTVSYDDLPMEIQERFLYGDKKVDIDVYSTQEGELKKSADELDMAM